MLKVTAELKRVLKKTGCFFLNMGDCYNSQGTNMSRYWDGRKKNLDKGRPMIIDNSIPNKCLLMQPERLAIRMVDEQGFILRNKIKWAKQILIKKQNRTIGSVMPTCLSPQTEVYIKQETGIIAPITLIALADLNIKNLQILSPTGWKKIKDIWKAKYDKIMKFKVGSSSEIESSLQHRFPISHDNRRKRYEIKEAQDLRMGKNKMLDRFLFVPVDRFLDRENFIENAYTMGKFVGLIVAEGGFNQGKYHQGKITLHKKEKELADFFIGVLKKFEVKANQRFVNNYQQIQFYSKDVRKFYEKFCIGKCKEKKLDMVMVLNAERNFRQGLFDGIIAGDGHIDKNKRITFGTASKQLRDNLYLLASSVGLLASKYGPNKRKDKRTGKIYTSYFLTIPPSLQKEKVVGERECEKGKPLSAKYKNEFKAKTLKFSNPKIEKGIRWLVDIEVEDRLFLINGGIVSHNSVKDRFNESGEELYFFVKNKKYYSDLDAVRLPNQVLGVTDFRAADFVRSAELYYNSKYNRAKGQGKIDGASRFRASEEEVRNYEKIYGDKKHDRQNRARVRAFMDKKPSDYESPFLKNIPTVWQIGSEPHNFQKELGALGVDTDHFAVFPQALCEIPIKFGCPERGIVLDPFIGSGTTALVAKKLGRRYIGIEISPAYIKIAEKRLVQQTIWTQEQN